MLEGLERERGEQLLYRPTLRLEQAIDGADFVFCAIRVGGAAGRVADERVALDLGVLGQETTGPGGLAYALRTVPVMQRSRVPSPRGRRGRASSTSRILLAS